MSNSLTLDQPERAADGLFPNPDAFMDLSIHMGRRTPASGTGRNSAPEERPRQLTEYGVFRLEYAPKHP